MNYTYPRKYAGSDWVRKDIAKDLSELGEIAANLLGDWQLGIYHLTKKSLVSVDWTDNNQISIVVPGEIATNDLDRMTMLVFLAHYHGVRVSVEGAAPKSLRLRINRTAPVLIEQHMAALAKIDWEKA